MPHNIENELVRSRAYAMLSLALLRGHAHVIDAKRGDYLIAGKDGEGFIAVVTVFGNSEEARKRITHDIPRLSFLRLPIASVNVVEANQEGGLSFFVDPLVRKHMRFQEDPEDLAAVAELES